MWIQCETRTKRFTKMSVVRRSTSGIAALFLATVDAPCQNLAKISGVTTDSLSGGILKGATIHLVGLSESVLGRHFFAQTDSAGRYSILNVPPGDFSLGLSHPRLDSLGIESPVRRVAVVPGDQAIDLATPSAQSVRVALCPQSVQSTSGVVFGHVFSTMTGDPLVGIAIQVERSPPEGRQSEQGDSGRSAKTGEG